MLPTSLNLSLSSPFFLVFLFVVGALGLVIFLLKKPTVIDPRAGAVIKTPTLNQYSKDLTDLARAGRLDPVIGR